MTTLNPRVCPSCKQSHPALTRCGAPAEPIEVERQAVPPIGRVERDSLWAILRERDLRKTAVQNWARGALGLDRDDD
jgi:hypothetical protein